ncbi:endonuclease G, mitochondrial isoform X1 [Syngnathus acus]|uniref:endonuclease G, mitochondrial isoform X1 n=1 Tax=Syngnathus acus TaxID=161584 RepID=UPI0018863451|nr:endonuclease G, mitochondrial isoform X1 [Syngnathus acus]
MRKWRTLATLSFGAAVGASASHLWRPSGGEEGLQPVFPLGPVPSVHAASELTLSRSSGGAVMKYGFPSLSNIRTRDSYVSSYDPRTRTPAWVIERLSGDTLGGAADRTCCDFKEDDSVHFFHRATNADYKGSGLDRGHMAAAANHKWSQKAMDDTFYLSNVAPQNPHLNQNAWNNLEKLCRSLTKRYANVYVCTGPLYLPRQEADGKLYVRYQVVGRNHVAVPTHFFKARYCVCNRSQCNTIGHQGAHPSVSNVFVAEDFEGVSSAHGVFSYFGHSTKMAANAHVLMMRQDILSRLLRHIQHGGRSDMVLLCVVVNSHVTCVSPSQVLILERGGAQEGVELRSYVLPNEAVDQKIPLERFLVPIETIERASGLLFVPNIVRASDTIAAK